MFDTTTERGKKTGGNQVSEIVLQISKDVMANGWMRKSIAFVRHGFGQNMHIFESKWRLFGKKCDVLTKKTFKEQKFL